MPSPIEDIKSRLDIVEFVQSYLRLQKAGVNYRALCPFHTEKTPSFFVSPSRQLWHCFGGCSEGGDIFKFVMKIEGLEFPDALELLARRAGVLLRREDPRLRSERARLYRIAEEASKIYEATLANTRAPFQYLKQRGLSDESIRNWRLGFAPDSWDYLIRALSKRGYRTEEIEKAGLAVKSEQGSYYDRFRSRIVFPVADASGRVVGFSGRIFSVDPRTVPRESASTGPQEPAKYINTPQTLIYDKSRVLYGFDKAKEEIRKKNACVLVEGQMDVVMSHQAGVENAVAVSGTALSVQQLKTLRRLCDTLVSSFDRDEAGERATKRSLDLAVQLEFQRKVAILPAEVKDPAEAAAKDPAIWVGAVETANSIIQFYLETALTRHNPVTAEGKKAIAREVLAEVKRLSSEVEKAHWMQELSRAVGVSEEVLFKELARLKIDQEPAVATETETGESRSEKTRREQLEALLLGTLILYPEHLTKVRPLPRHFFSQDGHLKLLEFIEAGISDPVRPHEEFLASLPADFKEQASYLAFQAEVVLERIESFRDRAEELHVCLKELEREWARERLKALSEEVRQAEAAQDQVRLMGLLEEFKKVSELAK